MTSPRKNIDYDVIEITNEMPLNRKGGVGSVVENLASGLRSLGVNVLWLLLDHNYCDFEVREILAEFPDMVVGSCDDLMRYRAPVINLHTYPLQPRFLDSLAGKKVIYTIHSLLAYEAESNNVDLSNDIRQQENLIAACSKVVLVSQAELLNYHKKGYHQLNPNVAVIHNGLRNPNKFMNLRRNKVIGFCGRLVPRKRPEYVPMVLTEIGYEDYSALIAGRGFSSYARDLTRRLSLENRVHYLGWCGGERLESFYNHIDVLAIPSTYEPFGMVALEAAARGIPIVCTRLGGLVEILGDYAFYSEDETYHSFRKAVDRWRRADRQTIKAVTRGALRRYGQYFTDVMMAKSYLHLFEGLP
jgi:glycosyltransferase involved in cell wall biosynthesis